MTNEIQGTPKKYGPQERFDTLIKAMTAMFDENQALRKEVAELKVRHEKDWEIIGEYEDREYIWNCRLHWFQVHQWDLWRHIWNYISICIGRGGQGV